ncbi:hypothetical protein AVEN_8212-1 [Araneus ventricosus]|uniref:Uncharacterized protein n=1 Tax=Araneus ventricosus TaxID=182803 RepID=A0A4Y2U7I8_ARAVE|nr:hypothetical protein AVEN_8212-1 [Araneus ventricosus]
MSLTCFFVLCFQMTAMFCFLCVFVFTKTEDFITSQIMEFVLIIVLMPPAVTGIIWCASLTNEQHQKILTAIPFLLDSYAKLCNRDPDIITYLNRINDKKFPVMSACGVLDPAPSLYLGLFGCLFIYGKLFLNLKG